MTEFKSGFVAIIGRPNVGKSTLLNRIIGEKLSIISNKPQTTRNNIKAIYNGENCQIIFMDTPGIHKPKHKLGEYMVSSAQSVLKEVDVVLFITTPQEDLHPSDKHIIERLKQTKVPIFLVINKVDSVKKEVVAKTIESYTKEYNFKEVIPISALIGNNIDVLLKVLISNLPNGPQYFPPDIMTDQPEKFIVSEIIREKLLHYLKDEVPHGTAVEIVRMFDDKETGITNIDANIYCEKDSHKAIIIGKGGAMLKKIGQDSRIDIERFLGNKVFLQLWVRVKKDWRDSPSLLKYLGY
ncbi:GTPase Era [Caloramator sp. E03]|uniref:GTPase Era n=1 Tax=Caloramator sp. E03 TaxID=2576307 RepID=UPI001110DB5E|nr:GTPase Era [Caloramator sp. E03]QCX32401.1 GTPase Era [Caloramator sp. E03]